MRERGLTTRPAMRKLRRPTGKGRRSQRRAYTASPVGALNTLPPSVSNRTVMPRFAISILLGASLAVTAPMRAAEPEKPASGLSLLRQIEDGFVQVFEKVAPSVVVIETTKKIGLSEEGDLSPFVAPSEEEEQDKESQRDPSP